MSFRSVLLRACVVAAIVPLTFSCGGDDSTSGGGGGGQSDGGHSSGGSNGAGGSGGSANTGGSDGSGGSEGTGGASADGSANDGGSGGAGGQSGTGGSGGAYQPCAGKDCGAGCSPCDPNNPSCGGSIEMWCQPSGECKVEYPTCGDAGGSGTGGSCGAYDPCAGKDCGAACSQCAPEDHNCVSIESWCDAVGQCKFALPACPK